MKLKEYLKIIEEFVKDYLESTHLERYVLGLSGGVDSTLVAAIVRNALGKERLTCIAIPIESHPSDLNDAKEVAKNLDVELLVIDGTSTYQQLVKEFENNGLSLDTATKANIKVRTRMIILYAYAQMHRGLVIGTDNADEKYTGYFTKYGDGAVDVLPIVYLVKKEVVEACKIYGVKDHLANRTPTAGLFEGQTDEKEMGVSYKDLDDYLLGKEIDEKAKERIEHLHRISEHKRVPIPSPIKFDRD